MSRILAKPSFHIALIVILGLISYSNTFNVPFQWDDKGYIIDNPIIKDMRLMMEPSKVEAYRLPPNVLQTTKTRTVAYLTFLANYKAHGLEVRGYHAVNLAIHILNSFLIYSLILLIFKAPAIANSGLKAHGPYIALFSALLFVAHPIQTQAVTYITQRFTSLAAFFCLLSLAAYAYSRLSSHTAARYALYALSVLSATLAMKTKENSFTFPLVIALFEFIFFGGPARKRLLLIFPLLLTMLIIPLSIMDFQKPFVEAVAAASRSQTDISRYHYLVTQFSVIATYLRLLVLPVNQNLDYDYRMSNSFLEPHALLSFVFLACAVSIPVYIGCRWRKKKPALRLVIFGVVWFFLALAVESSVLALDDIIFEHRLYLPSPGAFLAAATAAAYLFGRLRGNNTKRLFLACSLIIIFALSYAAYTRNTVWESETGLWEDVVKKSPRKSRPHNNLGASYLSQDMIDKAIEQFLICVKLNPKNYSAYYNLGLASEKKGLNEEAVIHYQHVVLLMPDHVNAHNNLGSQYKSMGQLDKAIEHYRTAIRLKPDAATVHNNLGNAYAQNKLTDLAIKHYRIAIGLIPDYAAAHHNLSMAYESIGDMDAAVRHYSIAVGLNPDFRTSEQDRRLMR